MNPQLSRHHRRKRLSETLAVVLCFVLIAAINASGRNPEPGIRWYTGRVGQVVASPYLEVTVHSVTLAEEVNYLTNSMTTEGTLVVIEFSVAAKKEKTLLSEIWLETGTGLVLEPRGEFKYSAGFALTEAGFTRTANSVFQLPPGALPSADLVIHADRLTIYTYSWSIRIHDVINEEAKRTNLAVLSPPMLAVTR